MSSLTLPGVTGYRRHQVQGGGGELIQFAQTQLHVINKEKLHQVHKKKEDSFIAVVPEPGQCQTESIIAVEVSFFKKAK